jgi:hypothetical protein
LAGKLEQLTRGAVYPARQMVPANAEAVVFADRAELLACLAEDLVSGNLALRWWWGLFLGTGDREAEVFKAFYQAPEYIPSTLQTLLIKGHAISIMQRWTLEQTRALTVLMVRKFALHACVSIVEQLGEALETSAVSTSTSQISQGYFVQASQEAPWQIWLGNFIPELAIESELLLGIALSLQCLPAVARSNAFAHAVKQWITARKTEIALRHQLPERDKLEKSVLIKSVSNINASTSTGQTTCVLNVNAATHPDAGLLPEPAVSVPQAQRARVVAKPAMTVGTQIEKPASYEQDKLFNQTSVAFGERSVTQQEMLFNRSTAEYGPAVVTEWGGIFYLANLALYLKIFDEDAQKPQPAFFAFLVKVARDLLHNQIDPQILDKDPIWDFLDGLAMAGTDLVTPESHHELRSTIQKRLTHALGIKDANTAALLLLRHHARVHLTPTHIDVVLSLQQIPIVIRLAGLDRDPGWVSAAGRFIAFHFE